MNGIYGDVGTVHTQQAPPPTYPHFIPYMSCTAPWVPFIIHVVSPTMQSKGIAQHSVCIRFLLA